MDCSLTNGSLMAPIPVLIRSTPMETESPPPQSLPLEFFILLILQTVQAKAQKVWEESKSHPRPATH